MVTGTVTEIPTESTKFLRSGLQSDDAGMCHIVSV